MYYSIINSSKTIFLLLVLFINAHAQTPVYLDSTANVNDRVEDLLSRMNLDEKIGQMTQIDRGSLSNSDVIKNYFLGSILSGGGSSPADNSPAGWANMYDAFQAKALETRLKIPIIYGIDAVHGHNNVKGAVIFPHNIGLGCTRNPELIKMASEITAAEVAATGIDWTFSPCIAVVRDERWGRTYEGFGETPELAQLFAGASVEGYQGLELNKNTNILACAKHYLGDGGTTGGDDQGNTQVDEETLRALHLPGFINAIQSGVGSIMPSYSSWNGVKMHGNKYLLTDVLKNELGFEGFLISDWAAIDQLPGNYSDQVEASINAGLDMIMVPHDYSKFISTLKNLVQQGKISGQRIDDAVRRILKIKFRMGLFEKPLTDRSLIAGFGSAEHRSIARQCVRESLVLLKKKDGILPLKKTNSKIFVAGANADDIGNQCGGWTISWQGNSGNITTGGTTILQAIQKVVQPSSVVYSKTGDFASADADYSIVVIGETPYAEGNGDKNDLTISQADINLVKKIKSIGKPVIVILISGRPMIIESILHYSDVIIAAWLPGTEGDGVADILFGDYQPSGLLSHSWPKNMAQIPINYGDTNYSPLFEYGYGITSLNDSPVGSAPFILSSIVNEKLNEIELSFNKKINGLTLSNAEFAIYINGLRIYSEFNLSVKENDPTTIVILLDEKVNTTDIVKVEYVSGNISSADGGKLEPFTFDNVFIESSGYVFLLPGKIEAENFSNMSGVQTESTSDSGGGLNVGWIDGGDWLEYIVDVPSSGEYTINFRVAAQSVSANVSLMSNNILLASLNLPVTGAWQNWTTVSKNINLNVGVQTFKISVNTGGFNLNWLSFELPTPVKNENELNHNYLLSQNYPNPFNPSTAINFSLEKSGFTELQIFNSIGQKVKVLINDYLSSGNYSVNFDASEFSSGIYFYKLKSGNFSSVKKMLYIK